MKISKNVSILIGVFALLTVNCRRIQGLVSGSSPQPEAPTSEVTLPALEPTVPVETSEPVAAPSVSLEATYFDTEGFFSLNYPTDWQTNQSGSEMQFWADETGSAALAISIQIKAISARALVNEFAAFLSGKWDNYREVSRVEMSLGGNPAVWLEHTWSEAGVAQHGFMAGVVRNRVGILILSWAPEVQYTDFAGTFEAVARSLSLAEFAESPLYEGWLTYQTDHFRFYYLPTTYVAGDIETIAADHEEVFEYNAGWMGVSYSGPIIQFYFYPSEESLYRSTARRSGFAINDDTINAAEVHAVWVSADDHQSLGHEMTHVITYWTLGDAGQALLGEGTAVCLDHADTSAHTRAADLVTSDRLLPLQDILGDAWFEHDPAVVYPQSGSIACWLLERYDQDDFKALYTREDFTYALQEIYGFDLDYLEQDWLTMLRFY